MRSARAFVTSSLQASAKLLPCPSRAKNKIAPAALLVTMATAVASAAATDSKPAAKKAGYEVPWVERYRPETLDDVVGNEDTLVRLRAIANDGNMPNLILCGPPGTGKVCFKYECLLSTC